MIFFFRRKKLILGIHYESKEMVTYQRYQDIHSQGQNHPQSCNKKIKGNRARDHILQVVGASLLAAFQEGHHASQKRAQDEPRLIILGGTQGSD